MKQPEVCRNTQRDAHVNLASEAKQKMGRTPPLVRDIDDWMFHFERRAAPRLRRIFTDHLEELPQHLLQLLDKLRSTEASRREANERKRQSSDR